MAFNMAARAAHPKNKTPTDCKWFREDLITYEVGEYNLIRVSSHFDCNPVTFLISLISLGNFGTPQPVSQYSKTGQEGGTQAMFVPCEQCPLRVEPVCTPF